MSIEDKLREMINSRYKNIAEFAELCGIKYQTLISIFNRGIGNANIQNIIKICQTLGISADGLAENKIIPIDQSRPRYKFEDMINYILEGNTSFEGMPLTADEANFIIDMITVSMEMLRKKRARQTP